MGQKRVRRLSKDQRFLGRIAVLKERFSKFNHPIPQKGFRSEEERRMWRKELGKTYNKVLKSKKYEIALKKNNWWQGENKSERI